MPRLSLLCTVDLSIGKGIDRVLRLFLSKTSRQIPRCAACARRQRVIRRDESQATEHSLIKNQQVGEGEPAGAHTSGLRKFYVYFGTGGVPVCPPPPQSLRPPAAQRALNHETCACCCHHHVKQLAMRIGVAYGSLEGLDTIAGSMCTASATPVCVADGCFAMARDNERGTSADERIFATLLSQS